MKKHVVLVGLSGAGKSTVGPLAAALLDTHFTDVDSVIERATGLPVAELFGSEGEAAFRARERQAVADALLLPLHVIAPGGGWAAEPGNLEAVAGVAIVVYLALDPALAAARLNGAAGRPLLGGDPAGRLAGQLVRREPFYRRATATVDASPGPDQVASALAVAARRVGGW